MYHKIETKFGNAYLYPTQGNHIFVDFGSNLNVEEEGGEGNKRRGPLTIRGVVYAGSLHCYKWQDGKWHLGPEDKGAWGQRQSLYMSKYHVSDYHKSQPTEAARNSVLIELIPLVNAWAVENVWIIRQAQQEHLADERRKREEEIEKKLAEIHKLEAEIAALEELKKGVLS